MLVGPGILGLAKRFFTPGQLSVEFVNVGGCLTYGDLALDSCAQFLAVAEHRLIPSRARSIFHQLRRAGYQSVWSPACQDQVAGGHVMLGLGSLILVGLLSHFLRLLPLIFGSFSGWVGFLRTTLPTAHGGVVHLFVVYGYQVAEEDADQLQLTDKLLQAVLAEAQVVCVGQPMLIAGDFNADPAVIPRLAKGISAGKFVDLALAYSLGAGVKFVSSNGRMVLVLVGIFLSAVQMRWLRPMLALLLIGGSLLTFW